MGSRAIRTLEDIARISPRLLVQCRCGHEAIYDSKAIVGYFHARTWSTTLAQAAARFRCHGSFLGDPQRQPEHRRGCGARGEVRLRPGPHPPRPPPPPAPVLTDREMRADIRRRRG